MPTPRQPESVLLFFGRLLLVLLPLQVLAAETLSGNVRTEIHPLVPVGAKNGAIPLIELLPTINEDTGKLFGSVSNRSIWNIADILKRETSWNVAI